MIHAHLIREADEEGRAQVDDWLDAPLTAQEMADDREFFDALNNPLEASVEELDERQRAFLEARGVIDGGPSS